MALFALVSVIFSSGGSPSQNRIVSYFDAYPSVACLQKQMKHYSVYDGDVDGLITTKTLQAFEKLRKQFPGKLGKLNLTFDAAVTACRNLGLDDHRARSYWPSIRKPLVFHFGPELSKQQRAVLTDLSRNALLRLSRQLPNPTDAKMADQVHVVITGNRNFATDIRRRYLFHHMDETVFSEYLEKMFADDHEDPLLGFAFRNFVFVKPPVEVPDSLPNNRVRFPNDLRELHTTLVHEFVHSVQEQRTAYASTQDRQLESIGSTWLMEGTATFFSFYRFTGEARIRLRTELRNQFSEKMPKLSALNGPFIPVKLRLAPYTLGHLAVDDLAAIAGEDALLKFYDNLGLGMGYEASFKDSFGISPTEFEEIFHNTRQVQTVRQRKN